MSNLQITQTHRYQIYRLLKKEIHQTKFAEIIGVHKTTISPSIESCVRNRGQRGYRPKQAHCKAVRRRNKGNKRISQREWRIIAQKLKIERSPEQISNKLGPLYRIQVSHECI